MKIWVAENIFGFCSVHHDYLFLRSNFISATTLADFKESD